MNTPKYVPRGNGGRLRDIANRMMNSSTPSSSASYSWLGWRITVPALPPNTTPHGRSVGAPHSSPFTKFAQRPKNRPMGTPMMARSTKVRYGIFTMRAATMPATNAPMNPPWKLMPPRLNSRMESGLAAYISQL